MNLDGILLHNARLITKQNQCVNSQYHTHWVTPYITLIPPQDG
jgi:hypothetical protein